MKKNLIRLLELLIVISAAFILTACGKIELTADDFVEFTDEGYDGIGTSKAEFDYKEMLKDVKDKMKDERYSAAKKILKNVTLSPETAKNVSNGQTVTFEWDIDDDDIKELEDECKLIIKFSDVEHKVSGLTPLKEVDLFQNLDISYSGYDTIGTIYYWYGESYVEYSFDKTEGLSNGDTVTVTAALDSWYIGTYKDLNAFMAERGEKPASLTKEIKVEGLAELKEYSPFQSVSLKLSGMDGAGEAAIATDWSDSYYYNWEYSLDKTEGLSNGDVITVTAVAYDGTPIEEYAAKYYGLKITETSKQFTVEGLIVLAGTIEDIVPEGLEALTEAGKNAIVDMVNGWSATDLVSIEKLGTVLGYEEDYWYSDKYIPYVYVIYRVTTHNDTDGDVEFYWYANCSNGVLSDTGSLMIDPASSYDTPLNHYSSWWGVSGEAFYGPSGSLYYVGFETLESLYKTRFEDRGLMIKENSVDLGLDAAVLFPENNEGEAAEEGTTGI
ncbi:MAG: hypothetical protein J5712_03170 [Lachnospiraceae bacterium]|nr:hypothetical protein [Lachnospiraceae bacterium]